jgi:DNA polymerase-1
LQRELTVTSLEWGSYRESEGRDVLHRLYDNPTIPVAVDTETTGFNTVGGDDHCIGVSIAAVLDDGPVSHYFGIRHSKGENISEDTWELLKRVLGQGRPLIWANVQFDVLALETIGIDTEASPFWDILTVANMVDENDPIQKSLAQLSIRYLKEQGKLDTPEIKKEKKTGWLNTTPEQMWDYAVADAVTTWRIWDQQMKHPEWAAIPAEVWDEKQKLIRVLMHMRRRGIRVDQDLAGSMVATGEYRIEEIKSILNCNPASNKDMYSLLIEQLGLPVLKKSAKTGKPSFDKFAMEEYELLLDRMESPVAKLIKEFRGWQKAISASYKPYLELVDTDGRLRCSYKTHGTVSGRLSCAEPNLQQIPKASDKPWNGRVKECFIAKDGYTLVEFDYSQLELRLGTAYANEPALKKVFAEGRDIFDEMSAQLGMTRQDTKTLVYSMQYGAGEKRIMAAFGVTQPEAKAMRENYFNTFPRFKALSDTASENAARSGRVRMWSGRYRHFQYPSESYKALNSIIQGGAADIVERIMVRAFTEIDSPDCQLLLQVHDSLLWEIRTDKLDEYVPRIKSLMEDVEPKDFDVRFAVEEKILGGNHAE